MLTNFAQTNIQLQNTSGMLTEFLLERNVNNIALVFHQRLQCCHSPVLSQQWGVSRQAHSILSSEELEDLTLPSQSSSVMEDGGELERYSYSGIVGRYCFSLVLIHLTLDTCTGDLIGQIKTWKHEMFLKCIKTYTGGVWGSNITVIIVTIIIIIITGFYDMVRLGRSWEQVTVYKTGHPVTVSVSLHPQCPPGVTLLTARQGLRRRDEKSSSQQDWTKCPQPGTEDLRKVRDNTREEVGRNWQQYTLIRTAEWSI